MKAEEAKKAKAEEKAKKAEEAKAKKDAAKQAKEDAKKAKADRRPQSAGRCRCHLPGSAPARRKSKAAMAPQKTRFGGFFHLRHRLLVTPRE